MAQWLVSVTNGNQVHQIVFIVFLDINECARKETNPCAYQAYCKNLPGAYHCSCPIKGFYVGEDGHTCNGKISYEIDRPFHGSRRHFVG